MDTQDQLTPARQQALLSRGMGAAPTRAPLQTRWLRPNEVRDGYAERSPAHDHTLFAATPEASVRGALSPLSPLRPLSPFFSADGGSGGGVLLSPFFPPFFPSPSHFTRPFPGWGGRAEKRRGKEGDGRLRMEGKGEEKKNVWKENLALGNP